MTLLKILVFSDSHRYTGGMIQAIEEQQPDLVVHLGDLQRDAEELALLYPKLSMVTVPGNCDWGSLDQPEVLTEYSGVRILMMHGHTRHVKSGAMSAVCAAREAGADILLFGHTHRPAVDFDGSLWVMNPGSVGRGTPATYGILTITPDKVDCSTFRI